MKDEAEECTNPGSGVKGQEVDQAQQLCAVEREGRRRRRREKREIGGPTHYEGQSSDDELLKTNSDKFSTGNLALTPPTMVEYRSMWKCCTA